MATGLAGRQGKETEPEGNSLWRCYRATDLAPPQTFIEGRVLVGKSYDWCRELLAARCPIPPIRPFDARFFATV